MANTAKYIVGGPTHNDALVIGGTSDTVQLRGTLKLTPATVAATGTGQSTAAAISATVTYVTAADGTKAVVLPAATAGLVLEVYNTAAAALPVFPASGDDINDGSADAAVTLYNKSAARFVCLDSGTWAAFYSPAVNYVSSASQAAVATTGVTQSSPYGFATAEQGDAVVTLVNALRAALVAQGLIKGS
jgi:hypothetical protein